MSYHIKLNNQRIIAQNKNTNKIIDQIGSYNKETKILIINIDKLQLFTNKNSTITKTVLKLLINSNIIKKYEK